MKTEIIRLRNNRYLKKTDKFSIEYEVRRVRDSLDKTLLDYDNKTLKRVGRE